MRERLGSRQSLFTRNPSPRFWIASVAAYLDDYRGVTFSLLASYLAHTRLIGGVRPLARNLPSGLFLLP